MGTLNGTAENGTLNESDISAFQAAKNKLAARLSKLLALRARAQKSGVTKTLMAIDADIKEANELKAKAAAADAMLAPFLKAWNWAKSAIGLGDLGVIPFLVPVAVAGSLTAIIYGINVLDRKLETTADRYEAEIVAVEKWKGQGLTTEDAQSQVNKTGDQITDREKNKPGLFGNLDGLAKFAATLAVIGGGVWWFNNQKKTVKG